MGVRSIRRIEFGSQDRISAGRGRFEPVLRENENLWETSALLEFRLLILFVIFSSTIARAHRVRRSTSLKTLLIWVHIIKWCTIEWCTIKWRTIE